MARKTNKRLTLTEKIEEYAKNNLTEHQRVSIAKKRYFYENKEEIIKLIEYGYNYFHIAEVSTKELHDLGTPKTIILIIEGEKVEKEVKISPIEVKNFYEQTEN